MTKPDHDLIFVAKKIDKGKVFKLELWEAKYKVYADGNMYYSARHKYRGRQKWTPWNDEVKRGRIRFPFTQAAKTFEKEGWTIEWKNDPTNAKRAAFGLRKGAYS
jgi:hypothetical protein